MRSLLLLLVPCVTVTAEPTVFQTRPITDEGTYLVTLQADPNDYLTISLHVDDRNIELKAMAFNDDITGLTVALPLKVGEILYAHLSGKDNYGPATSLRFVFVDPDRTVFFTWKSKGADTMAAHSQYVRFSQSLNSDCHWKSMAETTELNIPESGIYWVSARPDCPSASTEVQIEPNLFNVSCSNDAAIGVSGAFHLSADTKVRMKIISGRWLQKATLMSVVRVQRTNSDWLIAYTGHADMRGSFEDWQKVGFNRNVKTDFGHMYKLDGTFHIYRQGSYILGLCGAPLNGGDLRMDVYLNNHSIFSSYSEDGTRSGQEVILQFYVGDIIYVNAGWDRSLDTTTMMSISLLHLDK